MAIRGWLVGRQATTLSQREQKTGNSRRQYLWNTPDGDKPDFAETYTHGDEVVFSWNALNNSIYDLWLTSWESGPDTVAVCLASKSADQGQHHLTTARAANIANKGQSTLPTMAISNSSHPTPQRRSSPTRRDICSVSSPQQAAQSLLHPTLACQARAFCSSSRRFISKMSLAPRRLPCPQYPR